MLKDRVLRAAEVGVVSEPPEAEGAEQTQEQEQKS